MPAKKPTKRITKKAIQESNNPALLEAMEDADRLHALKVVLDQEGGRMLVDAMMTDAIATINKLIGGYRDSDVTETQLRAWCAQLDINLSTVRTLKSAQSGEKDINDWIQEELEKS